MSIKELFENYAGITIALLILFGFAYTIAIEPTLLASEFDFEYCRGPSVTCYRGGEECNLVSLNRRWFIEGCGERFDSSYLMRTYGFNECNSWTIEDAYTCSNETDAWVFHKNYWGVTHSIFRTEAAKE